jgi:poly-beta-1,6-N-acetyl-D-glucosamine biosynthesis protein PgaD
MKPDTSPAWPPVIEFGRAPWWVRLRDTVLTVAGWLFVIYVLRDLPVVLVDYFSRPFFELDPEHPLSVREFWERMATFAFLAVVVMVWLTMWSFIYSHRLRFAKHKTSPAPLPLATHAASFGLDAATVEGWQKMKTAVVEFDAAGCIARAMPGPSPGPEREER